MDERYGQQYRILYDQHWWWRARERVIVEALRARRPAGGWRRALDIGCGDGLFFERLGDFATQIEGVEPESGLVSDAGQRRGTIHQVPFDERFSPTEPYSLVVMLDVLEHLREPMAALGHVLRILEPAGTVLITVPAFRALWTRHDEYNQHYTRYTKATLAELASSAGLEIDYMEYFFHWVFPAKLGQRVLEKLTPPRNDTVARIPPTPVNRLLYVLARLEYAALRPLGLPFGSSLLCLGGTPGQRSARESRVAPSPATA
jgi:SAM-dependent methyltransferase